MTYDTFEAFHCPSDMNIDYINEFSTYLQLLNKKNLRYKNFIHCKWSLF